MEKISYPSISNGLCPQAMFMYGTYKEDGTANYGMFCWATYCAADGLKFVACIGEDKLTRDRIRATGMFSATVVTEKLLAQADYCGTHTGYQVNKEHIVPSVRGMKLDVPVPVASAWTFELRVADTLHPLGDENNDIYICEIVNIVAASELAEKDVSFEEKLALLRPIVGSSSKYMALGEKPIAGWGSLGKQFE